MDKAIKRNIPDHAREISFAAFRVSALIEQTALRAALESAAIDLAVKSVLGGEAAIASVNALEQLVRLSEAIGEIKPLNGKVLVRELSDLRSEIGQSVRKEDEVDLGDMFGNSDNDKGVGDVLVKTDTAIVLERPAADTKPKQSEPIKFNKPASLEVNQAGNRQSAILQFVRGLPNGCRMKDLIEKFPNVSERTLRNDLQTLVYCGSIERFGAVQGPFSYYRAKSKVFTEPSGGGHAPLNEGVGSFLAE